MPYPVSRLVSLFDNELIPMFDCRHSRDELMLRACFCFTWRMEKSRQRNWCQKVQSVFHHIWGFCFFWSEGLWSVLWLSVSNDFCLSLCHKAFRDGALHWWFSHLQKELWASVLLITGLLDTCLIQAQILLYYTVYVFRNVFISFLTYTILSHMCRHFPDLMVHISHKLMDFM